MKIFLPVFILFLISIGFAPSTLARHGQILGVSAQTISSAFPLSEGPGLLLPNSPFYFIDLWRDNLNLLLASFNPPTKARLHLKIAAERIVEIKLMLEGRDVSAPGLDTALTNITQNIEGAKLVLKTEKNKGKNVEELAADLNQFINNEKAALKLISKGRDNRVRLKIKAVEEEIKEQEVEIEDELPEDALDEEIKNELESGIEDEVEQASESARRIELLLEKLNTEASRSARKALEKREEALRRAIEEQNKERQKVEEQLKKSEEKRQEELWRAQEKTTEEARKAAKEAQKAAEKLKESQEKVSEIRQVPGSRGKD